MDDFVDVLPPPTNRRQYDGDVEVVCVTYGKSAQTLRFNLNISNSIIEELGFTDLRVNCSYSPSQNCFRLVPSATGLYAVRHANNKVTGLRSLIRVPLPSQLSKVPLRANAVCDWSTHNGALFISLPWAWSKLTPPVSVDPAAATHVIDVAKEQRRRALLQKHREKLAALPPPEPEEPKKPRRRLHNLGRDPVVPPEVEAERVKRVLATPGPFGEPPPGRSALDQGYKPGSGIVRRD